MSGTKLVGVRKRYRRTGPWVLDGVELLLPPGSITMVVGSNGSGKSTLVRIAAGASPATEGRVVRAAGGVGYAPERLPARLRMTGRTYLGHMARLRGGVTAGDVAAIVESLDVRPGLDVPIWSLSKGNSQKVSLAQALMAPVGLLALDEPTSGLDAAAADALRALVDRRRRDGAAVVIAAQHDVTGGTADHLIGIAMGHLAAPPAAASRLVRVELAPPPVRDAPGVMAFTTGGRVALVEASAVDELLRWALQRGHSVVSVDPS